MEKVKIIAEVGVNHNGEMSLAKEMIQAAAESGADYVKFQSWQESKLRTGVWDDAKGEFFGFSSVRDFFKKTELSNDDHYELVEACQKNGVKFLTTCFDIERIDFLSKLGMDAIKVASCDGNSNKMIKMLSESFSRLIVSTGMLSPAEIIDLHNMLDDMNICSPKRPKGARNSSGKTLKDIGVIACNFPEFAILHCVSLYPTPLEKINLRRFNFINEVVSSGRGNFGISDHSMGTAFPKYSVSNGATWIEKHFTTDRLLPGPDNPMSINPKELKTIRDDCDNFILNDHVANSDNSFDLIGKDITEAIGLDPWSAELELKNALKDRFGKNS